MPVAQTNPQKHLGMQLDKKLNFEEHLKKVKSKVNKTIGIIRKLHNVLPRSALLTIWHFNKLPLPCRIFFNDFFSLKLRAWNFLTLSFYPLDTMWRNFIKKYWLVDKLWHFCHQWLAKSARFWQNQLSFDKTIIN